MARTSNAPTSLRIGAIDTLRGFTVLGILPVNIQLFSMIHAAYLKPAAYGDLNGWNDWLGLFSYTL